MTRSIGSSTRGKIDRDSFGPRLTAFVLAVMLLSGGVIVVSPTASAGGTTDSHGECSPLYRWCAATAAAAYDGCHSISVSGTADNPLPGDDDLQVDLEGEYCVSFGIGAAIASADHVPASMTVKALGDTESEPIQYDERKCSTTVRPTSCGPVSKMQNSDVSECAKGWANGRSHMAGPTWLLPVSAYSVSLARSSSCDTSGGGGGGGGNGDGKGEPVDAIVQDDSQSEGVFNETPLWNSASKGSNHTKVKTGQPYTLPMSRLDPWVEEIFRADLLDRFWDIWDSTDHGWANEDLRLEEFHDALAESFADEIRRYDGNVTITLHRR